MNRSSGQPFGKKVLYSLGSMSAAISGQVVGTWLLYFYVDINKLPIALYGLGMVIYSIWNAINDPLAGHISDRTRSRWGRRIPYIAFLTLPLAIALALVWMPPSGLTGTGLFIYFVLVLFAFDTLFTFVILNWTALFPEMYPSLEERSQVSALRQFLAILGMVLAMALPPLIYTTVGWATMGIILAGVTAAGLYLSLLGSRERPESRQGEGLSLIPALKATFVNRSFVTMVLTSLFAQFTFVVLPAAMPLYAKYVLGIADSEMTLIFLAIFGVALVGFFVWSRIVTRIGPREAFRYGLVLFSLGLVPFLVIKNLTSTLIAAAFLGVGLASLMMVIDILISDVVDEDELKTGVRREGMYFGVHGFVIRLGIALQGLVFTAVLTWGGYVPDAAQTERAVLAIRSLLTIVPWVALALSFIAISLYPLHGRRLAEVRQRLAAQRVPAGPAA